MPMPTSSANSDLPPPTRNRRGCFVILGVVLLAILLYMFAGFSAEPGNRATEEIQTVPARSR